MEETPDVRLFFDGKIRPMVSFDLIRDGLITACRIDSSTSKNTTFHTILVVHFSFAL